MTETYPNWYYEIKIFQDEKGNLLPYIYDSLTGYMVMTSVTVEGKTKIMWLPVMDNNNKAMLDHPYEIQTKWNTRTVDACNMFDINKAIMRCLVKNIAMFGLGLKLYAGEDLPVDEKDQEKVDAFKKNATAEKRAINKTYKDTEAGKETKKKVSEMSIDERYNIAIAFLDKQTTETYPNVTGSYKDSVNRLIVDLNNAKDARAGILQDKVNQLMQIEDWSL